MNKKRTITPLTSNEQTLVVANLTLAKNLSGMYAGLGKHFGVPQEDLEQEACWGLCIAAQKFDSAHHAGFETYASKWCIRYIMRAISNEPVTVEDEAESYVMTADDDIEVMGAMANKITAMLSVLTQKERDVVCLVYGLPQSELVENCLPKDFREIARIMQLTPARVHQMYDKAMAKMELKKRT